MNFDEMKQRLHAVMDAHKISRRKDLVFFGEIMWALGLEANFKLVPRDAGGSNAEADTSDLATNESSQGLGPTGWYR